MNDRNDQKPSYGVVTEQGDLGLGFAVLNESEQRKVEDHKDRNQSNNQ